MITGEQEILALAPEAAAPTAPADKRARIAAYDTAYESDVSFESVMVWARQRTAVEFLSARRPHVVVEVGCGPDLLVDAVARRARPVIDALSQWVIVEPNPTWAASARARCPGIVTVVEGFVEDCTAQVLAACRERPDVVVCASVLHEVPDPLAVAQALAGLLGSGGTAHVNVPNAASMHRRLALAMGLAADLGELGDRNHRLQQYRVFDADRLRAVLESAGLQVVETGGAFVKPFTHAQMATLRFLSPEVLDGLYDLGRSMPELAAQIHANAVPRLGEGT